MADELPKSHPAPRIRPLQERRTRSRLQLQLQSSVGVAALLGLLYISAPRPASAQTAPAAASTTTTLETITIKAQRRLLKEKDSPSASTEIGAAQIAQAGAIGSVATLLESAPSVNVYQQGVGNSEPVISIRGVRGIETAETLDGVPMQDLLNGGTGQYLQNIIGGRYNTDQIQAVNIYPGVAYPDKNTFGTIGGTVAYDSKRPSKDMQAVLSGSVGSFGTYNESIELDSGQVDSGLGSGDNAPTFMLKYSNLQTKGYVQYTPARYNSFEAAFDKPFDDGLSKIQGTLIFNTGNGLYTPEPVPLPYLQKYGLYSNYPTDVEYSQQKNDYLSIILKGDKYVNDYLGIGATAFYLNSRSTSESWSNVQLFTPPGTANPYEVNGALPFLQTADGFGVESLYGYQNYWWAPSFPYDGNAMYPAGTKACPAAFATEWANTGAGYNPCGYNAALQIQQNHTYGFQPRVTITPPDFMGISNTIKIGGLLAQEVGEPQQNYFGGNQDVPQDAASATWLFGGSNAATQRTIMQAYVMDKIDFFDNTLHITPGVTAEGTFSSYKGSVVVNAAPTVSACGASFVEDCDYGPFKAVKWDRDYLPFLNVAYDFDKILPAAKGLTAYASLAQSALFAPTTDFSPNILSLGPPYASIVHMYEGGLQYDTPKIGAKLDYFYQKIDRDFGFFQYQSGPAAGEDFYDNDGQREIKGVEFSGTYQVTPAIQLTGSASHQLDKYLKTSIDFVTVQEDQFGFVQKDTPATGVPDWTANFGVDYKKKSLLQEGDTLDVHFAGHYTGHQYTTYDTNGYSCYPSVAQLQGLTCGSYGYYSFMAGQTLLDPNGGINPFTIFNLDLNYSMPTPSLKYLREVTFDLNVDNLFDQHYWAYYYKQISPGTSECAVDSGGNLTTGPFKGNPASNYCGPEFADGIPGAPVAITFTVSAKF